MWPWPLPGAREKSGTCLQCVWQRFIRSVETQMVFQLDLWFLLGGIAHHKHWPQNMCYTHSWPQQYRTLSLHMNESDRSRRHVLSLLQLKSIICLLNSFFPKLKTGMCLVCLRSIKYKSCHRWISNDFRHRISLPILGDSWSVLECTILVLVVNSGVVTSRDLNLSRAASIAGVERNKILPSICKSHKQQNTFKQDNDLLVSTQYDWEKREDEGVKFYINLVQKRSETTFLDSYRSNCRPHNTLIYLVRECYF